MGVSATPLALDRVRLVNPGQTLTMGDRRLNAIRPPSSTIRSPPLSSTTGLEPSSAPIVSAPSCPVLRTPPPTSTPSIGSN